MKNWIVITKCRWNGSETVHPRLQTEEEADKLKARLTNENNTAEAVRVR